MAARSLSVRRPLVTVSMNSMAYWSFSCESAWRASGDGVSGAGAAFAATMPPVSAIMAEAASIFSIKLDCIGTDVD